MECIYSTALKSSVSGAIFLEIPDRPGIMIWMERQSDGEEQLAFAIYNLWRNPWSAMELNKNSHS